MQGLFERGKINMSMNEDYFENNEPLDFKKIKKDIQNHPEKVITERQIEKTYLKILKKFKRENILQNKLEKQILEHFGCFRDGITSEGQPTAKLTDFGIGHYNTLKNLYF